MTSRAWRRRSGRSTRSAEGGASTVATAMPSTTASRSTPPSPQSWATACGGSPTAGARDIGPSRRPAASRPGSISSTARWCIPSARRAGHVVGKPEEGKLHVRFAEGALETGLRAGLRHRQGATAAGNSHSPALRQPRQCSTLRVCAFRYQDDAERFYRVRPHRLKQCNLQVAPDKTHLLRCSRVHPSMRRHCTFLGCALYGRPDRQGVPRVKRRTARKKLHAACRRRTAGLKQHRHLPGRAFDRQWHIRVRGHDHYDGLQGNSRSLHRCFERALRCTLKWRHRRGGKRQSFPWEPCTQGLDRRGRARPRLTEVKRRSV
jgi:RNA-directed DNA polymerase